MSEEKKKVSVQMDALTVEDGSETGGGRSFAAKKRFKMNNPKAGKPPGRSKAQVSRFDSAEFFMNKQGHPDIVKTPKAKVRGRGVEDGRFDKEVADEVQAMAAGVSEVVKEDRKTTKQPVNRKLAMHKIESSSENEVTAVDEEREKQLNEGPATTKEVVLFFLIFVLVFTLLIGGGFILFKLGFFDDVRAALGSL